MQELSRRTRARLLTDIAFATTLTAAAIFSVAAARAQTNTPPAQNAPLDQKDDKDKPKEPKSSEPTTTGETRAAPAPRLPSEQMQPPMSGKPLDEPDKALNPAPPEKIEGK